MDLSPLLPVAFSYFIRAYDIRFSFILVALTSARLIKNINEVVNRDAVSGEISRVLFHLNASVTCDN